MNRQEVFDWCRQRYGTEPDYPWNDWNAVLRHTDNNKWYGVIIEVDRSKLGMDGTGVVDVLNVKCDPTIIGMLRMQPGRRSCAYIVRVHSGRRRRGIVYLYAGLSNGSG